MTAFSEKETNALVCGRIHALEFQILFTIDGVNFYHYDYWHDLQHIDFTFKELIYGTCCKNNIGLPDFWLYKDIVIRVYWCILNNSTPKHIKIFITVSSSHIISHENEQDILVERFKIGCFIYDDNANSYQ